MSAPYLNQLFLRIVDQNDKLLTLVMQYPQVENTVLINQFEVKDYFENNEGIRYDAYATMVFNMLQELFAYVTSEPIPFLPSAADDKSEMAVNAKNFADIYSKMNELILLGEYLDTHKKWWDTYARDIYNEDGDTVTFVDGIDFYYDVIKGGNTPLGLSSK